LVAADGGGSRVRRQFLPHAQRVETGVAAIAGKVFLDTARDRIARPLLDGISLVAARGGYGLFVAIQEMNGGAIGSIGANDPAFVGAGNIFENTRSYLMWALSANRAAPWRAGRARFGTSSICLIRPHCHACRSGLPSRWRHGAPDASRCSVMPSTR
jgi:hypothetical protein